MVNIKKYIIVFYVIMLLSIFTASYYILSRTDFRKKKKEIKYEKANNFLKRRKEGYFSYDRIYDFLKRNGNPLKLSPGGYIIAKSICAVTMFILFSDNVVLAFIFAIIGFLIIDFIISANNRSDMKKIRLQLVDVYDFLNIQTSAGVFIGAALTECYLMVRNKRLKKALAELCAEINLTKDINSALDKFSENFNSVEIESFIMTVKQSLITGKIEQALGDLSNSQKEMNLITIQEQTDNIKVIKDIIQIMMYIGILAVVFLGLTSEFSKGFNSLF